MRNPNTYVKNYHPLLDVIETQKAIQLVKRKFIKELSNALDLVKVSAPLFVEPQTGLNDNLNGKTKAVNFVTLSRSNLEIVQSLAKWKRDALKKFHLSGLYTNMVAIRPKEELNNVHSLYVDQWDWEKIISNKERNLDYLKSVVKKIYHCFLITAKYINSLYPVLKFNLPNDITFVTADELLKRYPRLSAKQREYTITKKYGSVFIMNIGCKLSDGTIHDDRAADYDDWSFNGDILVWNPVLNMPIEISSMGIRVNKTSLLKQLKERDELYKLKMPYHQDIVKGRLPLTIGGGIGQSRLCMFMLQKAHIGEIHASYWGEKNVAKFKKYHIDLL
ncbi:MAG: aspartate--ammonia ligase [Bacilli bacterium]|nr:aspartate--ammonia ligase [Bacilli bacterium]